MSVADQAAHHVGAHPPESDHSQLHDEWPPESSRRRSVPSPPHVRRAVRSLFDRPESDSACPGRAMGARAFQLIHSVVPAVALPPVPGCCRQRQAGRLRRGREHDHDAAATPRAVASGRVSAVGRDRRVPADHDGARGYDHNAAAAAAATEVTAVPAGAAGDRCAVERAARECRRGAVDDRGAADVGDRRCGRDRARASGVTAAGAAERVGGRLEVALAGVAAAGAGAAERAGREPCAAETPVAGVAVALDARPVSQREGAGNEDPVTVGVDLCPAGTVRSCTYRSWLSVSGLETVVFAMPVPKKPLRPTPSAPAGPASPIGPRRPVVPGPPVAPLGPAGPAGPGTLRSVPRLKSLEVNDPFLTFAEVTASAFNCAVPTLLRGSRATA